ncbi:MAG: hypothetical protein P8R54_30930 [Myxococcota bacterium]|nr:hypothetical protein [Myxococcota bacterium]
MTVRGSQAAGMYEALSQSAGEVLVRYKTLRANLTQQRATVVGQQEAARQTLAAIYLPRLAEADLDSAERLTGFRGFTRRSPIKAMENERHRLKAKIETILASETYQRRTFLVGPVGEYTRELEEATSMLDPWQRECHVFECLEGFEHLYEIGYDTPAYAIRWWEGSYWRNWKMGDAICDALSKGDFGDDVLPAYKKVRAPRDQWRDRRAEVGKKIKDVHDLVMLHDQSVSRLQQLPQIYLAESQKMLAGHLEMADPGLLAQWAGEDRGLLMALRTLSGLQAKIDFLNDAIDHGLTQFITDLSTRQSKYNRKVIKYRRSKHYSRIVREHELDRKFPQKVDKYLVRCEKLEILADRVVAYDQYDSFELDNPPELWFYEFSGGKSPSRLTPSLRRWYDSNPSQRPRRDPAASTRRAAAAVPSSQRLEELGYLS